MSAPWDELDEMIRAWLADIESVPFPEIEAGDSE